MAKKTSVQQFIKIQDIKDGVVQLKDGSLRSVIFVSSVNFALKSEDEKNATVASFQGFINSLNFPLQIVVRSKRLDLDEYLKGLENKGKQETNKLLQDQTLDYVDFIRRMLDVVNIMDKEFFVVVPFYGGVVPTGVIDKFTGKGGGQGEKVRTNYDQKKNELLQRVDTITAGLTSMGLKSAILNTEELIELYYSIYNPTLERTQKLSDIDALTAPIIEKGTKPEGEK